LCHACTAAVPPANTRQDKIQRPKQTKNKKKVEGVDLPPPEAKATYATVHATVVAIAAEQVCIVFACLICFFYACVLWVMRDRVGVLCDVFLACPPKPQFKTSCAPQTTNPSPSPQPSSIHQYINHQTMYYLANPETGRKVVERDGRYWSEAEGRCGAHGAFACLFLLSCLATMRACNPPPPHASQHNKNNTNNQNTK
jgi:hypothetical protein